MQADQHLPVKQSPTRLETNREHEVFSRETADNSPAGYRMVARLFFQKPRDQTPNAYHHRQAVWNGDRPALTERYGEPAGARTRDPRLKRAMLYQLSYRLTEQRARILPLTLGPCLARIIHDTSAANVNARLRRTVSPFSPSTCCASMPQGVIAPSIRLMRVCTLCDEPS